MPLLDRLTPSPPDDEPGRNSILDEPSPPIVPGRPGRPSYSLGALRELIERQFREETRDRPDILRDLDSEDQQRQFVGDVAGYVLAQHAIRLDQRTNADLLERVYRTLFTFGPLEESLRDPEVVEIIVSGPHTIHARNRSGSLEPVQPAFDDTAHLASVAQRLIAPGGAGLSDAESVVERGTAVYGRPVRITLVRPPVNPDYSLRLRLHPAQALALEDLALPPVLIPPVATAVLRAILATGRGMLIVGGNGTGKTTLAGALARALPSGIRLSAAERAAEIHLPPLATRHAGDSLPAALNEAIASAPDWLLIDEIRGDESALLWDMLISDCVPRLIAIMQGTHRPDRLLSALTIPVLRQYAGLTQGEIHAALARHLPYLVTLKSQGNTPSLDQIGEWQLAPSGDFITLHPLVWQQDGKWTVDISPGPALSPDET